METTARPELPDPPPADPAQAADPSPPRGAAGVRGTLEEMWRTRPVRSRHDRLVGGVAAAVARRYDIDPLLVRIAFVVAAIVGTGGLLYVAGYAALPAESPGQRVPRPDTTEAAAPGGAPPPRTFLRGVLWVGLAVATVGDLFRLGHDWPGVLVVPAVALLLLVLLHRRTHVATGPDAAFPTGADEPHPIPAGPPVTAVTVAVALVAAGIAGLALLIGVPGGVTMLLGVVLTVLAVGLVVGAFLRTGRGLIPIALVVALATWVVLAAPWERWSQETGRLRAEPATAADVAPMYARSFGEIELDLRGLDTAAVGPAAPVPISTEVSIGTGEATVWLPRDADVTVTCTAGQGEVECLGRSTDGGTDQTVTITDLGRDGAAGGRPIDLTVRAEFGSVQVHRG